MFPASSTTETRLALLEEKMGVYEQMMKRIDSAIEKISETSQSISKMLAIHNERLEQCTKADDSILVMIDNMRKDNKEHYESLNDELNGRLDKVEEKVEEISKIKWMTVGCGTLLAILVAAFASLASGWWTPSEMQIQHEGHLHQQNVVD